jgi:hypothetical protein
MDDLEHRLSQYGRALQSMIDNPAPSPSVPEVAHDDEAFALTSRGLSSMRYRRTLVVAACAIAATGFVSWRLIGPGNQPTGLGEAQAPDTPLAISTPSQPTPTSSSEGSVTSDSVVATPGDQPITPLAQILRPYVDPKVCMPLVASESTFDNLALQPFAWGADTPLSIQAIGDSSAGPGGSFAVVLRYAEPVSSAGRDSSVEINGWTVSVRTYANGNGDAVWDLPDGTQGYLRSRGLDREDLYSIVSALNPRDLSAPTPGFDYSPTPDAGSRLQLVAEHISSGLAGQAATFQCRVQATGAIYRITSLRADPIVEFMAVIDRPLPIEVGIVGDSLIIIDGSPDPSAPTLTQIVDAQADVWEPLLLSSIDPTTGAPLFVDAQILRATYGCGPTDGPWISVVVVSQANATVVAELWIDDQPFGQSGQTDVQAGAETSIGFDPRTPTSAFDTVVSVRLVATDRPEIVVDTADVRLRNDGPGCG